MGEDLVGYFSNAEIIVGSLESAQYTIKGGVSMSTIDIFIVVGKDDSSVQ